MKKTSFVDASLVLILFDAMDVIITSIASNKKDAKTSDNDTPYPF